MTPGEMIEFRLNQKRCIKCGIHSALVWPYHCDGCLKAIDREQKLKRQRQDDDDERGTKKPAAV